MSQHKRWIENPPTSQEADRPSVRMPLSYFTRMGNSPPGDSYWPEYAAFLKRNPHHALNHPRSR